MVIGNELSGTPHVKPEGTRPGISRRLGMVGMVRDRGDRERERKRDPERRDEDTHWPGRNAGCIEHVSVALHLERAIIARFLSPPGLIYTYFIPVKFDGFP